MKLARDDQHKSERERDGEKPGKKKEKSYWRHHYALVLLLHRIPNEMNRSSEIRRSDWICFLSSPSFLLSNSTKEEIESIAHLFELVCLYENKRKTTKKRRSRGKLEWHSERHRRRMAEKEKDSTEMCISITIDVVSRRWLSRIVGIAECFDNHLIVGF